MPQPKRTRPRSPESVFIRTGEMQKGLEPSKAKKLGARFLSRTWHKAATHNKRKLPLPTFKQRLHGGKLQKADLLPIRPQVDFVLTVFGRNLNQRRKEAVQRQVEKSLTGRILSVNAALREKTTGRNLEQMRTEGKELYHFLKEKGRIYLAVVQETGGGKTYFAKGWSGVKGAQSTPIHEAVHILQKLGIIRIDVPFAQAADRLYGLENSLLKLDRRIPEPTELDFNRTGRVIERKGTLYEADWSYSAGKKLGQWIFTNLNDNQRWDYLFLRCMGNTHESALKEVLATALKKAA